MKKLLCTILAAGLLTAHALADDYVNVEPGKNDLTQAQAKDFAVAFFAEKCGVEESVLREAQWTIQFGHSTLETAEDAVWSIYTRSIEGHPGVHHMNLTGPGEVIEWEAHGPTYDKPNPGLLDYATPVTPLPADAQAEAVIALVRAEMVKQGFTADASGLTITPVFAYDAHFNSGDIPVWLVQIDGLGNGWKAAVTHKGELLSLVTAGQAFQVYTTEGEDFWAANFPGESYIAAREQLAGIQECTLSHAEKAEITAAWRPLVAAWIAEHPYYLNRPGVEYDMTFVHIYGVPDDKAIPQQKAEELAKDAVTEYLGGEAYHEARVIQADYFVTNPDKPVWYVRVGRPNKLDRETKDAARKENPDVTERFRIMIDAYSGEVYTVEKLD